jgi:hypothetical protein
MKRLTIVLSLCILVLGLTGTALAHPQENSYEINWWTVDTGAGVLTSLDGYILNGTIGQPEGGALSTGEHDYQLVGGYWSGGISGLIQQLLYLPLILK